MQILKDVGFKSSLACDTRFIKEWDYNKSTEVSDTTLAVNVAAGYVTWVSLFTDKLSSNTGSYYVFASTLSKPVECNQKFIDEMIFAAKRVAQGSHKNWVEMFGDKATFVKMS